MDYEGELAGTFFAPGGLLGAFYLLFVGGYTETCVGVSEPGSSATLECTGGISNGEQALWLILFALLVVVPILTTIVLGRPP